MSTRGFIGFVVDGVEKIAYNHSDSYPSWLGQRALDFVRSHETAGDWDDVREAARRLRVVDASTKPTPEDVEQLAPVTNRNVGRQSVDDWYVLLRETQGEPDLMLRAGVIEDAGDFPLDSLFAEWGYLIDLDRGQLEVYEGFQKSRHSAGRFADRQPRNPDAGYFPVRLIDEIAFADAPESLRDYDGDES